MTEVNNHDWEMHHPISLLQFPRCLFQSDETVIRIGSILLVKFSENINVITISRGHRIACDSLKTIIKSSSIKQSW